MVEASRRITKSRPDVDVPGLLGQVLTADVIISSGNGAGYERPTRRRSRRSRERVSVTGLRQVDIAGLLGISRSLFSAGSSRAAGFRHLSRAWESRGNSDSMRNAPRCSVATPTRTASNVGAADAPREGTRRDTEPQHALPVDGLDRHGDRSDHWAPRAGPVIHRASVGRELDESGRPRQRQRGRHHWVWLGSVNTTATTAGATVNVGRPPTRMSFRVFASIRSR